MKLIDKYALVAEIEKRINEINLDNIEDWRYRLQREHDIEVMKNILSLIDTLEVKEVDLEKEIDDIFQRYKNGYNGLIICNKTDFSFIAKHFFELGMSVNNKLN